MVAVDRTTSVVWSTISLFAGVSLHIYSLQTSLFKNLSPFADGYFWADSIRLLLLYALIASATARIALIAALSSIRLKIFPFIAPIHFFFLLKHKDRHKATRRTERIARRLIIHLSKFTIYYSICLSITIFLALYIGPLKSLAALSLILVVTLPMTAAFGSEGFSSKDFHIAEIRKIRNKSVAQTYDTQGKFFGLSTASLIIFLNPVLLLTFWILGQTRAETIKSAPASYLQFHSDSSLDGCYSILARTQHGLLLIQQETGNEVRIFSSYSSSFNAKSTLQNGSRITNQNFCGGQDS